jgi:prolyl 4-hydroxylase
MVEYDLPKEHFIGGWYIDNALCSEIVEKYNTSNQNLPYDQPRQYSWIDLGEFDHDLSEGYCGELIKVLQEYKDKFNLCHEQLQPWGFTRPRLQAYKPGDSYHVSHCENDGHPGTIRRHLAFMTYLTSIDEGGGTEFVQQELTTPSQAGLTVIWPAGWTHYHKGVVAPNDAKYIVTGWCCF